MKSWRYVIDFMFIIVCHYPYKRVLHTIDLITIVTVELALRKRDAYLTSVYLEFLPIWLIFVFGISNS